MGDGRIHGHMDDQIEIRCEDCHGTDSQPPQTIGVQRNDPLVQTLIRSSPLVKAVDGDEIVITSKGRPLPHVRKTPRGLCLTSKLTGKEHPVTVVTGKKDAHGIKGHARLECDSCHSAWSPQCYGCHQVLDFGREGLDHLSQRTTPGRWAESRSYFRHARNIMGINSRGRVGILVPGCQVWNTVVDAAGEIVQPYVSLIMPLKNGLNSVAVGPVHPHTTVIQVPRCVDCHLDPKAMGLGEGRLRLTLGQDHLLFLPAYDSSASGLKIDFPPEAVVDTEGRQLRSTSHKLSRPFSLAEIRKITAIAPCLPCHDRYDDPIRQKPVPYAMAEPCRRALDAPAPQDSMVEIIPIIVGKKNW